MNTLVPDRINFLTTRITNLNLAIAHRAEAVKPYDDAVANRKKVFEETLESYRRDIVAEKFSSGSKLVDNIILYGGAEEIGLINEICEMDENFKAHQGQYLCVVITETETEYYALTTKIQRTHISVHTLVGKISGDLQINPDRDAIAFRQNGFRIELPTSIFDWSSLSPTTHEGRAGCQLYASDGEPLSSNLTPMILCYLGGKDNGAKKIASMQMDAEIEYLTKQALTVFRQIQEEARENPKAVFLMNEDQFLRSLTSTFRTVA